MQSLIINKKAYFNYEVLETYTAGIKLEGREIKALRFQKASFPGSFVSISDGRPFLQNLNIPKYRFDGSLAYDPKRKRLLLLKKPEIERIAGQLSGGGTTIVPLEIGFERQWAKVKIGVVRGKQKYDKRRQIKEREEKRKIQRVVRRRHNF